MRILLWHVHGSWTDAFVRGPDTYLLPVLPDRGPDGRGRARTWTWPGSVEEHAPDDLADVDVVVLQRPHEAELVERWTGRRPGVDVPAVYVEHNTPPALDGSARHVLAHRDDVPVVHVSTFNAVVWDCGRAPTLVVPHGIPDPGALFTGERPDVAVVVNEPVRRGRAVGTDLVVDLADRLPLRVYGMGTSGLEDLAPALRGLTADLDQRALHRAMAGCRVYLHPFRWTSLGLSLIEAMTIGMPVLALATTAAPEAVPPWAGLVSCDVDALVARARRWLADPEEARTIGAAARAHALDRFGLDRFLSDWQQVLKEVTR